MQKNVILCDDHSLLRNGIKNWIQSYSNFKVTGETHVELLFGMSGMEMQSKFLGGVLNIKSDKETGTEGRIEIQDEKLDSLRHFFIVTLLFCR